MKNTLKFAGVCGVLLTVMATQTVHGEVKSSVDTKGTVEFKAPDINGEDPDPTNPVNPSDPNTPIDPTDPTKPQPEPNPGGNGFLRIDFAPKTFDFGQQPLPTTATTYYANPLKATSADGSVSEDWINYVQVSDKRGTYAGWSLSVKQNEQFKTTAATTNNVLEGAKLTLGTTEAPAEILGSNVDAKYTPSTANTSTTLTPGKAETVVTAQSGEGLATWVYRFGDDTTKDKAIALEVPAGKYVEGTYQSNLTWTLTDAPLANE
jgi:hypothetical protein